MAVLGPFHPGGARMITSIGTRAAVVATETDERTTGETEGIELDAHAQDPLLVGGPVPALVLVPVRPRGDVTNEREAAKASIQKMI